MCCVLWLETVKLRRRRDIRRSVETPWSLRTRKGDETAKGVWEEVGAKASEGGTRGVASVWSWLFGSWGDGSYLKRRSVGRRMLGHGGTRFAPADAADEDLYVQT